MIYKWHSMLDMPKHDKYWHLLDLADELTEYHEETKIIKKWSELSDVVYTYSRAKWSGHEIFFPLPKIYYKIGVIYMIPKYSGRWLFYRSAGKKAKTRRNIREVRNPKKTAKLNTIAIKYDIDPVEFQKICEKQLKYWLLLP